MRRTMTLAAACLALCGQAMAAQGTWEEDLRQMGYLFLHLSSINAINGVNLTREQAVKLRRLARQVEAVAAKPPSFTAPLRPELAEVRAAWLAMREALLRGENPSEALRKRAHDAYLVKSQFVRTTLRPLPAARSTQCASCHRAPEAAKGLGGRPMTAGPRMKRFVDLAHSEGLYGKPGLWKVARLTRQVDEVLTDAQKAILGSFTCCLAPPRDLSDPMRAGQAESNARELALLRKVPACPEGAWPLMRMALLASCDPLTEAVSPGATAARKARARQAVAKTLDRARGLSEVAFEMEKAELARQAKAAIVPAAGQSRTKAAYFLLIPGATEAYTAYIEWLDARAARP